MREIESIVFYLGHVKFKLPDVSHTIRCVS